MRLRNTLYPSKRDLSILTELWRWKLLSSLALHQKFFSGASYVSSRVRLWELRKKGLIACIALDSSATEFAWTLTEKGFRYVKTMLPELREDGFASESLHHDFLVSALHLGDWLIGAPSGAELFSEQELRRIHPDFYPLWVPRTERHRPDGYSRVPIKGHLFTFAFEVELTQKRNFDYRDVASFYDDHSEIDRIVWVVKNAAFANTFEGKLKGYLGEKHLVHVMVPLGSFLKNGWQAEIVSGYDKGYSLSALLDSSAQRARNIRCARVLLDNRKTPGNSSVSKVLKAASNSDRLPIIGSLTPNTLKSPAPPSTPESLPIPNSEFINVEGSNDEKNSGSPNRSFFTP